MKTKLALTITVLIGLGILNTSAMQILVPSEGTCVRQADAIVKGTFAVDGTNVTFLVTSTMKGQYKPQQRVPVIISDDDRYWGLPRLASELQAKECIVLGTKQDDGVKLPLSICSVWPPRRGSSEELSMFGKIESCTTFITAIIDYEKLEQRDPQELATRLIQDVQDRKHRPFALAYLNSEPDNSGTRVNFFGGNVSLYDDVVRIVTTHIVTRHVDDEWTFKHMCRLGTPPSITLPYFLKIANGKGEQAEKALWRLRSILHFPYGTGDLDAIKAQAQEDIPIFQQLDAKRNIHLFDSPNEAIAGSASLVFSTIFNEPAPKNMTRAQEKAFWQAKIKDGK